MWEGASMFKFLLFLFDGIEVVIEIHLLTNDNLFLHVEKNLVLNEMKEYKENCLFGAVEVVCSCSSISTTW
jgi:hypothetical protein